MSMLILALMGSRPVLTCDGPTGLTTRLTSLGITLADNAEGTSWKIERK